MLSACWSPNRVPQKPLSHSMAPRSLARPSRPFRETASSQAPNHTTTVSTRNRWLRLVGECQSQILRDDQNYFFINRPQDPLNPRNHKTETNKSNVFVTTWQEVVATKHSACCTTATGIISFCVCVFVFAVSARASAGEAQGDVPADAGSAAIRRKVPPANDPRAGHREEEARRLHEQERRLHQPPGAGERKVRRSGKECKSQRL